MLSLKVIGIGDNVVDKYIHTHLMYPGGNALNFSVYSQMLGAKAAYLGVFGNDEAADHVKSVTKKLGISLNRCRTEKGENGYACIDLINNDRVFLTSNKGGVSREKPLILDKQDLDYIKEFDLACTSINSHLENELIKLKSTFVSIAYDFSTKGTENLFRSICPNIEYAIISCGDLSLEETKEQIGMIHRYGSPNVIATRGAKGSLFSDGQNIYSHEAHLVKAKDTLGAGDSFLTAFLLSYVGWKKEIKDRVIDDREKEIAIKNAMEAGSKFAAKSCLLDGAFGYGKVFV